MKIYSNQSILCRNIGQVPLRVTQSCAADYLDRTKPNQTPPSIEKTWLGIMQNVCLTIFQLEACWIYPSLGNGNTWMAWEKCIWRKKDMDAMFILFQVPLINKNGTKSMHCIIRGKFVISPCRKSALFWIHAVILLFHAEILPCGPPLLPHSCAEPFLGVMQKYSFLGDIYTSDT